MNKAKLAAVLFDLDGTLLDTAPDLGKALNILLQRRQRQPLPFHKIRPVASHGTKGLLGVGFNIDENAAEYEDLRTEFIAAYHENLLVETKLFDGMLHTLEHIENSGLRWGIVTNKPAWLANLLVHAFQLDGSCACVIGGDSTAKRKPDPEPLLHACELIGCQTDECLYVGNAERDVQAAHNANMRAIIAGYGYLSQYDDPSTWGADNIINQPTELIEILNKLNSKQLFD